MKEYIYLYKIMIKAILIIFSKLWVEFDWKFI